MKPLKTYKTFAEQLALLEERGMIIDDQDAAYRALRSLNYYRFTGYAFQFKKKGERYQKGVSFEQVMALYQFDKALRRVLHGYLEDIEIYARTQIAYYFADLCGGDGHYDARYFKNSEFHQAFLSTLTEQIEKNKDAAFVSHHIHTYGGKMPIWTAVEVLSFSTLSKFFSNLMPDIQNYIAANMGFDSLYIANWLHCFAVLRNTCAHYGRIYNCVLKPSIKLGPKTNRSYPEIQNDSLFAYVVGMARFMPDGTERFLSDLTDIVEKWETDLELGLLGFPANWEELMLDGTLMRPATKPPMIKRPVVLRNESTPDQPDVSG